MFNTKRGCGHSGKKRSNTNSLNRFYNVLKASARNPTKLISVFQKREENNSECDNQLETPSKCLELQYQFRTWMRPITGSWKEFQSSNEQCFTKGCKWAPDGTCIVTNSNDNILRIYDLPRELHCQASWPLMQSLPEIQPSLKIVEGGTVYDYCWYPFMSSWDPLSCCLLTTCRNTPVHLWDAFTGELRCSYVTYNDVHEVDAAYSIAFSTNGQKLYCGFRNCISIFNIESPGQCLTKRKFKDSSSHNVKQTGIVSCICMNPAVESVYAVGTYTKSIGLYSEPEGLLLCMLKGQSGGITHLMFSPDGTRLYSGGRKDSEIVCWDIRNPGTVLFTLNRKVHTNQRIYFDISPDGRYITSGQSDGIVRIWDTSASTIKSHSDPVLNPAVSFRAHADCVNGISIHSQYPILATSSGQRHFHLDLPNSDSENENDSMKTKVYTDREDSFKLWWIGKSE